MSFSTNAATGSLFLATLSPKARTYILRLLRAARRRGYNRFVEPCAGALAMSHLAVQAGFDPSGVEASDVSVFSAIMGYAAAKQPLDPLGLRLHEDAPDFLREMDLNDPAVAMWVIGYLRIHIQSLGNPVAEAARQQCARDQEKQIEGLRAQVKQIQAKLGGMKYEAEDMYVHLERVWDDPRAVAIVNPPTYTGGFERYYDMGGLLSWKAPEYGLFDAETGVEDLMERAASAQCLVICYQERPPGQAVGDPIYLEGGARKKGIQWLMHMYLTSNRGDEARALAGGVGIGRRVSTNVRPGDFPILPLDYVFTKETRLELLKLAGDVSNYYRELWTHRFNTDSGPSDTAAILVDGYLMGVFGYNTALIAGGIRGGGGPKAARAIADLGPLYLHYGVTARTVHNGLRLSRLLLMVAMTRESVDTAIANQLMATRAKTFFTTMQTKHRTSKMAKGLLELDSVKTDPIHGYKLVYRAPIGEFALGEVIPRWLEAEERYQAELERHRLAEADKQRKLEKLEAIERQKRERAEKRAQAKRDKQEKKE